MRRFIFYFSLVPVSSYSYTHCPPTLGVQWSIRLSIHRQKWLWHLLKHPVECSGLKGYPMLWPKTSCFFFYSPFPFHQKLLCDIVHWHVGFQTKAWVYLNLHQCKTAPPTITPAHTIETHWDAPVHTVYTKMQNTQIHWTQEWPNVIPHLLKFCSLNETSIFY